MTQSLVYTMYRIVCTQRTAFKDLQMLLMVHSVQGKKVQPNNEPKTVVHSVQYYPYTAYSVQTLLLVYSVQGKKDRT